MPLMSNPYVTNVAFISNQIVLTVQVDDYEPDDTVEISGTATQTNGAFAVFNAIQRVPAPNPDGKTYMYVKAPPSENFKKGHAVTVVLRAARVWTTVLGEEQSEPVTPTAPRPSPAGENASAEDGHAWSHVTNVTYAGPSSAGNDGQESAGNEAGFRDGI
jgi:hypothetical protein